VGGGVAAVLRREAAEPVECRAHDLEPSSVGIGELAIERVARLVAGEHDTDVPVRALVDHEVAAARAEDV